jgi:hypothetical protein
MLGSHAGEHYLVVVSMYSGGQLNRLSTQTVDCRELLNEAQRLDSPEPSPK